MPKIRSPNYPSMSLVHALEAVRPVYKLEHKNRMARETLGKHLGHSTLNGRALSKIGALRAYGLVEGSGNELRVSDDAIHALMAPDGAPERLQALIRLALRPSLFNEIHIDFPSAHPSEDNLRFWLIKEGFTSEAAGKAAATYLETMRLVSESPTDYNPPVTQEEPEMTPPPVTEIKPNTPSPPPTKIGMLQEVFNLEEGPVTLMFPATLSSESYQDLEDHLAIFLRKAKRRSEAAN